MFVAWANGACLCAPVDEELIDPVGFANRTGVTCWFSVPSVAAMARRMRRLGVAALPELRLSLFCGEPLPISIAKSWSEAAPNAALLNLYGPTEATIAITAYRFDPTLASSMPPTVPLGDAYDGSAAVPVRADGEPADIGEDGELWLAGAQLTDGYINNPQEQAAKFIEAQLPGYSFRRWYRSGDLVRRDIDWGLVYQGRLDDQVKISGYRVEILEIEEALRWAAGTSEVAAVPWPLTDGGAATGVVGFVCGATFESREQSCVVARSCPRTWFPREFWLSRTFPSMLTGRLTGIAFAANSPRACKSRPSRT